MKGKMKGRKKIGLFTEIKRITQQKELSTLGPRLGLLTVHVNGL